MKCEFLNPVNIGNEETQFWAYSEMVCEIDYFELVENIDTGSEFYLQKTFSYGDALIIWFLTIFLIFGIVKTIYNFIWKP